MPKKPTAPKPNIGKAPNNAKPDLKSGNVGKTASSGVKSQGATGRSVKPTAPKAPDAKGLAGGKMPNAKPDLNAGNIKKTTK
jgi:hypothetical protein